MAAITVVEIEKAGAGHDFTSPVIGTSTGAQVDTFVNDGRSYLFLHNPTGGGAKALTITTPITIHGQAVADRAISLNSGATKLYGPFDKSRYGSTVTITWTDSGMRFAVLRFT